MYHIFFLDDFLMLMARLISCPPVSMWTAVFSIWVSMVLIVSCWVYLETKYLQEHLQIQE